MSKVWIAVVALLVCTIAACVDSPDDLKVNQDTDSYASYTTTVKEVQDEQVMNACRAEHEAVLEALAQYVARTGRTPGSGEELVGPDGGLKEAPTWWKPVVTTTYNPEGQKVVTQSVEPLGPLPDGCTAA